MDTQSYLMSLGWAGPGHPLHPSAYKQKGHRGLAYNPNEVRTASTGNGLINPLLVSKKQNNLGLGRRAHEPQQGNEWWLKGFEKALGDVGKSESERSSGVSTPVPLTGNGYERKHAGLYSFFVKGQKIEGTIDEHGTVKRGKKRKSDAISSDDDGASEKEDLAKDFEAVASFIAARDKDDKKRHRRAKSTPQEEFKQAREYFNLRDGVSTKKSNSDKRTALKLLENEGKATGTETKPRRKRQSDCSEEVETPIETKEERRERRRRRKEEKEARKAMGSPSAEAPDEELLDDTAAKAVRKEERRRRRAEKAPCSDD